MTQQRFFVLWAINSTNIFNQITVTKIHDLCANKRINQSYIIHNESATSSDKHNRNFIPWFPS